MSRKKATFLNLVVSVMRIGVSSLLALVVSQQILVRYGSSVNGVVATATQIVLLLQVLEGGFTTATLVALYRPFVERDYFEMNAVLSSTARSFRKIAGIALAVGIGLAVIYPLFLKTEMPYGQRVVVFGLVVLTSVLNFAFFQSRQIMFAVAQKEYIPQTTAMICTTISQLLMLLLLCFDLSILWLRAGVFFLLLLNGIWVCLLARKIFPYWKIDLSLPRREIKGTGDVVWGNCAAILYKISPIFLIATFFGAVEASIYSVYYMFFSVIGSVLYAVTIAPKSAFGQLWHDKNIGRARFSGIFHNFETALLVLAATAYGTCAVFSIPLVRLYTAGLPDSADYQSSIYVVFFCVSNFLLAVHSVIDLMLQISGHFKIIKFAQSMRLLTLFLFGCGGGLCWGIHGLLIGLLISNFILLCCEIFCLYHIVLQERLRCFVKRCLALGLVGGALIAGELWLNISVAGWGQLLVVAAIVGVCNLTVMGGGGFMLVSAEDRKRFWKYLQNKWRGGNRFEVTK